jgi:hypothetical protein
MHETKWMGSFTLAIISVLTFSLGCKQKPSPEGQVSAASKPVYGGDHFDHNAINYDLPLKIVDPMDVNEGVRRASEYLKTGTAHGIKWTDGNLSFEVVDGAVTLNGKKVWRREDGR